MADDGADKVISDFPFSSDEDQKGEFTCPTCGESFDTSRGKNIHMGQVHPE